MTLRKSLSQHLLKDKNLLNKLVKLAGIGPDDVVIEIGAGQGDLTRALIPQARFVHAIELDRQFKESLDPLEQLFPNVRITFNSILNLPLRSLVAEGRVKVMGNIPYNITGNILFKLLSEMDVVESAHLTMQKEVGERLVSAPFSRSYGALSVIFQLYATVKLLLRLKPSLFIPPPEVESAFVAIMFNKGTMKMDEGLIDFIKACFRFKRKYLRHCLEPLLGKDRLHDLYQIMGFQVSTRAEELRPEIFQQMYDYVTTGSWVTGHGKQVAATSDT